MNSISIRLVAMAVVLITSVYLIADADARGRGGGRGGGGFSRGGMASHGSFGGRGNAGASRLDNKATGYGQRGASNQPQDRQESRQDFKNQDREDRQDYRTDTREDRQGNQEERRDDIEDEWDDHHYWNDNDGDFVAGVVVGGAIARSRYYYSLPCSASAIYVNSVNYYNCSGTWYSRGYAGSRVTYVVSSAPAGY
jgi:hypothetical protein